MLCNGRLEQLCCSHSNDGPWQLITQNSTLNRSTSNVILFSRVRLLTKHAEKTEEVNKFQQVGYFKYERVTLRGRQYCCWNVMAESCVYFTKNNWPLGGNGQGLVSRTMLFIFGLSSMITIFCRDWQLSSIFISDQKCYKLVNLANILRL